MWVGYGLYNLCCGVQVSSSRSSGLGALSARGCLEGNCFVGRPLRDRSVPLHCFPDIKPHQIPGSGPPRLHQIHSVPAENSPNSAPFRMCRFTASVPRILLNSPPAVLNPGFAFSRGDAKTGAISSHEVGWSCDCKPGQAKKPFWVAGWGSVTPAGFGTPQVQIWQAC